MGFTMRTALTASTLLLAAGSAAMEYVACYDTKDGLTNQTSYTYQSTGWCQDYCEKTDAAVFALTAGADCLCGDELPPSSGKVPDSKCNTNCQGWPSVKCMYCFDPI
jgi:cell wall integrity and stress response component